MRKIAFAFGGMILTVVLFSTLIGVTATWWPTSAAHSIAEAATESMRTGNPAAFFAASAEGQTRLKFELLIMGVIASASSAAVLTALLRNVHWTVALSHPILLVIAGWGWGALELLLALAALCIAAGSASWLVYRRSEVAHE